MKKKAKTMAKQSGGVQTNICVLPCGDGWIIRRKRRGEPGTDGGQFYVVDHPKQATGKSEVLRHRPRRMTKTEVLAWFAEQRSHRFKFDPDRDPVFDKPTEPKRPAKAKPKIPTSERNQMRHARKTGVHRPKGD